MADFRSGEVVKNPSKIYIGNIPRDANEIEIEKMFEEVGRCIALEFKGDFAFVEYCNDRSAAEAISLVLHCITYPVL